MHERPRTVYLFLPVREDAGRREPEARSVSFAARRRSPSPFLLHSRRNTNSGSRPLEQLADERDAPSLVTSEIIPTERRFAVPILRYSSARSRDEHACPFELRRDFRMSAGPERVIPDLSALDADILVLRLVSLPCSSEEHGRRGDTQEDVSAARIRNY